MLAASFAIYAPMYTYKIGDLALSERIFGADTNVIASGRIDPLKIEASLYKAKFTSADADELTQLKILPEAIPSTCPPKKLPCSERP